MSEKPYEPNQPRTPWDPPHLGQEQPAAAGEEPYPWRVPDPSMPPAPPEPAAYEAFPAAPPPKRSNTLRYAVAGSLAALLILGIGVGAFFALGALRGSTDKQDALVPADADLYATVLLDPSISQKANLLQLAHRFPDSRTDADLDKQIAKLLDQPLKEAGLGYEKDVKPWLGGQISMELKFPDGGDPTGAALLASKNDGLAQKALDKSRGSARDTTWSKRTHDGVVEWLATPKGKTAPEDGYAIVSHTVVIGDPAGMDAVIDVAHNRHAAIRTAGDYQATLQKLPDDRFGVAFLNVRQLLTRYHDKIAAAGGDFAGAYSASLSRSLDAFGDLGLAMVAQPSGLEVDSNLGVDTRKLDPSLQGLFGGPARGSAAVSWIPSTTYGFFAVSNMKAVVESLVDQLPPDSVICGCLQHLGITGPGGIVNSLSGDAAFEMDQVPGAKSPAGAVLLGTTDPGTLTSWTAGALHAALGVKGTTDSKHNGVTIHTFPGGDATFRPAYAITSDGMAIFASTPDELARILDAHSGASGVASTQAYKDSVGDASVYQSLEYLDVQRIIAGLDGFAGTGSKQFDSDVKPYLAPVKAVSAVAQSDSSSQKGKLFVLIK